MIDESTFKKELTNLINKHGKDNEANTADFLLANYLCECLQTFTGAVCVRDEFKETEDFLSNV